MQNLNSIRSEFPALELVRNNKALVYLDSAASTLKPKVVVDRISKFYLYESSNVHRGAHFLSDQATANYEQARGKIQRFINAKESCEIIFTKGTTESINLLASSFTELLREGDEILLTEMEHHSNIVPWQRLAERKALTIRYIPLLTTGELDMSKLSGLLTSKTKIVSFVHCSNGLGTLNPINQIVTEAKKVGAKVHVDVAQSITALPIDVQKLNCDFVSFSAHKMFGPTGIGVLYGKKELLNSMSPYQSGGSMISEVTLEGASFLQAPQRFEAGTPHIAGAIGFGSCIDFINELGQSKIYQHEIELMSYVCEEFKKIPELKIIGQNAKKLNIITFGFSGMHPMDLGSLLDQDNIAVRVGHHCAQPLMKKMNINGTVRASFSIYNNEEDISRMIAGINKAKDLLL